MPRTDLDDVIPDEQPPRDACGVFGVWAPGEDVSKITYFGIFALQHRGQEAAGIAVADGRNVVVYKDLGLVAQVFDEPTLMTMTGHVAIGHTRYSTTGSGTFENAQPSFKSIRGGRGSVALAHNGNLTNTKALRDHLVVHDDDGLGATTDSDLIAAMLAANPDVSLEEAAMSVLPQLRGAFSLTFMDETTLYAARDSNGVRPLVIGRLERGWVVASETAALDIVGASFVREVAPGELVLINVDGVRSRTWAAADPKGCLLEYVYLARPDTMIAGRRVHAARVAAGQQLAREAPVEADLVIPVPESGGPAAIGYSQEAGIPYDEGLVKNRYVGRTFIQPSDSIRQLGIRLKYNPVRDVLDGKRVVVVDDTIVRGNTQRALVRLLREAGAVEVHVRISSPPIKWPCHYGIDFATKGELVASSASVDEVCAHLGATSLAHLSLEGLVQASTLPKERLCRACFDGAYPIEIPNDQPLGKFVLEGAAMDALGRPAPQRAAAGSQASSAGHDDPA